MNIDEEPQLAEAKKIEVIPTLVLYRGGKAVDSIVAPDSKAVIERFIQDAMDTVTGEETTLACDGAVAVHMAEAYIARND